MYKYSWNIKRGNEILTGSARTKKAAQQVIDGYCLDADGYELFKSGALIAKGTWTAAFTIFEVTRREIAQPTLRGYAA